MTHSIHRTGTDSSTSSGRSHRSNESCYSGSTAATEYTTKAHDCSDRPLVRCDTGTYYGKPHMARKASTESVDTYASTSEEEVEEEDDPQYEVPSYNQEVFLSNAISSTPRDFGDLFPSSKRLSIRHDDATMDGNMNLRVDTQVETKRGNKLSMTLFHLRMHDLRTRDFSLRRYCRESGREVCHSIRKYQKPPSDRPSLQRSMSSALGAFLPKSDSRPSTAAGLRRADSGYESFRSLHIEVEDYDDRPQIAGSKSRNLLPTNTIKLEFSNYAHLDVKRRGASSNKRYAFEHWGANYSWKRTMKRESSHEQASYHLLRDDSNQVLAHIVPMRLTPAQSHEETARGGWIHPCYMRILDESVINSVTDLADVVVSTGLMALVDDSIKRHFLSKSTTQLHIPLTRNASWKFNVDYVGPKRLIDEMFHRRKGSMTNGSPMTPTRRPSVGIEHSM